MAKALYQPVFEDPDILVLNKSAGLPAIPSRNANEPDLKSLAESRFGDIFTVHRIDRDTSGLILFARNAEIHKALSQSFMNREIEKTYHAIVRGVPSSPEGIIDAPIEVGTRGKSRVSSKGKPSLSRYKVLESFDGYAYLQVIPSTGRQHQIRVHLAHIGHPLIVDPLYSSHKSFNIAEIKRRGLHGSRHSLTPLLQRTPLHAFSLKFNLNGVQYFEAVVPKDIRATLNQLTKWRKV